MIDFLFLTLVELQGLQSAQQLGRDAAVDQCTDRPNGWHRVSSVGSVVDALCDGGRTLRWKSRTPDGSLEDCENDPKVYGITTCSYFNSKGILRRQERFNNQKNDEPAGWEKTFDELGREEKK